MKRVCIILSIFLPYLLSAQLDYNLDLPENSGMWNIKTDFGAIGDGITDDTEAFREAFRGDENRYLTGEHEGGYRALYIPPGTYLVSDSLVIGDKKKVIFGAGKERTIIRLKANTPGFTDANNPKIFIDALAKQYLAQNFFMHIKHLSIEIGEGNPGAVALKFHTNNTGAVFDVDIKSLDPQKSGLTGILMTSWPGPGLIKHVTVDGFDYGMEVSNDQYSMTFEHILIKNSRIAAFRNNANTCSIRKLTTENTPVAVINSGGQSMMTLIDCNFSGTGEAAIINKDNGMMLVRNLTTTGFDKAISSFDGEVAEASIEEWISHEAKFLFPSPKKTLGLNIEETPEILYSTEPGSYVILEDIGDDKDITQEFQDAIDSGVETIFLPPGNGKIKAGGWYTSETIIVRGNVKRIMGLGNSLLVEKPGSDKPAYRIEEGTHDTLIIENFYANYGAEHSIRFEHASTRTLVLRFGSGSYRNVVDGTVLFVEDVVGEPWEITNGTAWIRDLNTESYNVVHVTNDNSKVWTLGHKTEKDQTVYATLNGGKTELLGGLLYKNNEKKAHPAFTIVDAEASLSYRNKGLSYLIHVDETRNGIKRVMTSTRTHKNRMSLFCGYSGGAPLEISDLIAEGISESKIKLNWTDHAENESGYIIYRSEGSDFTAIDTIEADRAEYIDEGLEAAREYDYMVLAYNDVSDSWTEYFETATGTTLNTSVAEFSAHVRIFPNPIKDELNIELLKNGRSTNPYVAIYNMHGKIQMERNFSGQQARMTLSLKEFEPGIYVLRVRDGKSSYSRKIVVE